MIPLGRCLIADGCNFVGARGPAGGFRGLPFIGGAAFNGASLGGFVAGDGAPPSIDVS